MIASLIIPYIQNQPYRLYSQYNRRSDWHLIYRIDECPENTGLFYPFTFFLLRSQPFMQGGAVESSFEVIPLA